MPLNPLGVLDLSIVTDRLKTMLEECRDESPLWITPNTPKFPIHVSGSMPESARKDGGCQLTVSLVHIAQDKFQRNSPVVAPPTPSQPPRPQLIPNQPLSLDLYYLITAFSDKGYVEEQQAMSIALRCFHENPIVRTSVVIPVPPPQTVKEEFTLTMEIETSDELARLWQAVTAPFRLSVVYKASVVFITPPAPALPTAKQATRVSLAVDPTLFPYAQSGQVIGTSSTATFTSPHSTPISPQLESFDYSPANVTPSQRFILYGTGLNKATSSRVYLLVPNPADPSGFTESDVTADWKPPNPDPQHPIQTDSRITLDLPPTVGALLPANSPPPGVYQLRVGNNQPLGNPSAVRSNATPFSIAARVDVTTIPPNPPILAPMAGTYKLNGVGFKTGKTEVLLDTIALIEGPPGAGRFTVNVPGTTITFQAPVNLGTGLYTVRIRVNHVESPPSWWIQV